MASLIPSVAGPVMTQAATFNVARAASVSIARLAVTRMYASATSAKTQARKPMAGANTQNYRQFLVPDMPSAPLFRSEPIDFEAFRAKPTGPSVTPSVYLDIHFIQERSRR